VGCFILDRIDRILFRVKLCHAIAVDNIFYFYDSIINELRENNKFGTASNYELSKKSLNAFVQFEKGKSPDKILFNEITVKWLTKYENYMIDSLGRSETTVSMYLRALRTVFNTAISDKEIDTEVYPFRRNEQEKIQGRYYRCRQQGDRGFRPEYCNTE